MIASAASGYYNTNRFARILMDSIGEITGPNGLNCLLNYAGLSDLVNNPPPDTLDKGFDFCQFSALNKALLDMYGPRGGRGLSLRVGRTTFDDMLKFYGEMAGIHDPGFKILPAQEKIKFGLEAMARLFTDISDQQTRLVEEEESYLYQVLRCPVCWQQTGAGEPVCYYLVGLLQEGLCWISGGKEFQVEEDLCVAQGDDLCQFRIQKIPRN